MKQGWQQHMINFRRELAQRLLSTQPHMSAAASHADMPSKHTHACTEVLLMSSLALQDRTAVLLLLETSALVLRHTATVLSTIRLEHCCKQGIFTAATPLGIICATTCGPNNPV
jgi:hypothetical protein